MVTVAHRLDTIVDADKILVNITYTINNFVKVLWLAVGIVMLVLLVPVYHAFHPIV